MERDGKWQPIDSAPKDGRGVLMGQFDKFQRQYRVCYWTDSGWAFYQRRLGDPAVVMLSPTHWMPLPSPPEAKS